MFHLVTSNIFVQRGKGGGGGGRWAFYNWRVTLRKIEFGSLNKKNKKDVTTIYYLPVHFTFMVDFDFNVYFTSNRTKSSKLCEVKQEGNLSTDMDGKRKYNSTSL